jgi:hypothetical protein
LRKKEAIGVCMFLVYMAYVMIVLNLISIGLCVGSLGEKKPGNYGVKDIVISIILCILYAIGIYKR